MSENDVRRLLVENRASFFGQEPGYAAVPVKALEEAGADLARVQEWVEDKGGYLASSEVRQSISLRADTLAAPPRHQPVPYFAVPHVALNTDDA